MQPGAETILEETRHQQVFCLRATREKCGFHIPAGDGRLALPVTHTLPSLRTDLKSHGSHVSQAHPKTLTWLPLQDSIPREVTFGDTRM